jgi:ElaB/YqjD/DUF883 family membrane-anchored ribosome-binding protein
MSTHTDTKPETQPQTQADESIDDLKAEIRELKEAMSSMAQQRRQEQKTHDDGKATMAVEALFDYFKREMVRDTPIAALGVAIGVGLVTKTLLNRSRTDNLLTSTTTSDVLND